MGELARRAGLSAPRLSRLFEEQLGVSPTAVHNRQRLERFLRLYGRGRRVTYAEAARHGQDAIETGIATARA